MEFALEIIISEDRWTGNMKRKIQRHFKKIAIMNEMLWEIY